MCMLCVVPPNVIPDRAKLENSALNKPHGFGFAIVVPEEGRIICERTMNADESINRFLELRSKYLSGYAMWHARWATSGTQTVDNCHPFAMPDDENPLTTYVGHNGILDVIEHKHELRSDTRIFVEDLLPAMGGVTCLDNEQVWNLLEDFTKGSKVCVLTVHPDAQYQMYLLHEADGKADESGVWWSNNSCTLQPSYSTWYSDDGYAGGYDSNYDMYECEGCGTSTHFDLVEDDTCPVCQMCLMCTMWQDTCICYKPKRHASDKEAYEATKDKHASELTEAEFIARKRYLYTNESLQGGWAL